MRNIALYICLLVAGGLGAAADTGTTTRLQFADSSLHITTELLDNAYYEKITLDDLHHTNQPGAPMLPVKYINISVPYNAENFTAETAIKARTERELQHLPYPVQIPQTTDGREIAPTHAEPTLYTADAAPIAEVSGISYSGGANKIVTLAVRPVAYNALENSATLISEMEISLSWQLQSDISKLSPRPVVPFNREIIDETAEELKNIVVNPEEVDRNKITATSAGTTRAASANLTYIPAGTYEYLIVTNRKFAEAFERLAAYRKSAGYTAEIVCIEDILADTRFGDGDVVSSIKDDAGKLRSFLTFAYENLGTEYVLLAGDLPIRYGNGTNFMNSEIDATDNIIPTDLYFGELNDSWNKDGNIYYGQDYEISDYTCELFVGRLTCKSTEDIKHYIDKLLLYETNPGLGDADYLMSSYTPVHSDFRPYYDIYVAEKIAELYKDATLIYAEGMYPKGSDIINSLNNKNYGFVDFQGHGSPECVSVLNDKDFLGCGIVASKEVLDGDEFAEKNALDDLTNYKYPHWSYSVSCVLMPFDTYLNHKLKKNFGESYLMGGEYGGVAFLGNTRPSYFNDEDKIYAMFLDELKAARTSPITIGQAEAWSKSKVAYAFHHSKILHNILGDPMMRPWTSVPKKVSYSSNKNSSSLGGFGLEKEYTFLLKASGYTTLSTRDITLRRIYRAINKYKINSDPINIGSNKIISIYGKSIFPTFLPLHLHNMNFKSFDYFFTGDIKSTSKIIFEKGANITFEAAGDVDFSKETHIKSGARLCIISKGKVKISKLYIEDGGTLEIHAPTFRLSPLIKSSNGSHISVDKNIPLYLKTR